MRKYVGMLLEFYLHLLMNLRSIHGY